MNRNHKTAAIRCTEIDRVATPLAVEDKSNLLRDTNNIPRGGARELAHTAISRG